MFLPNFVSIVANLFRRLNSHGEVTNGRQITKAEAVAMYPADENFRAAKLRDARFAWARNGARETMVLALGIYLEDHATFQPEAIDAMSRALEEACKALRIDGQVHDREVVATRIIDLARNGVVDARALSERVIAEVKALRSL